MIPLILNKLTNEQAILTQHIQGLKPWQQLKDYRTLLVEFPSDQQQVKMDLSMSVPMKTMAKNL